MSSMNEPMGVQSNTPRAEPLSSAGGQQEPTPRLPAGVPVQVRNRFDGAWSSGFQLLVAQPNGYLVRRLSDGSVLPVAFAGADIRLHPVPLPAAHCGWSPPPAA